MRNVARMVEGTVRDAERVEIAVAEGDRGFSEA